MSKQLKTSMWLEVVSIVAFIIGISIQEPITSMVLLLIPIILLPVVIGMYYISNDEIRKYGALKKVFFGILLWLYIGVVLSLSRPIGVAAIVCLVIVFCLRDKRLHTQKTV